MNSPGQINAYSASRYIFREGNVENTLGRTGGRVSPFIPASIR